MKKATALRQLTRMVCGLLCMTVVVAPVRADEEGDFAFAQHLLRDGMYDLASRQLQDFIENHPNSPRAKDAFLHLADAYVARDAFAKAADAYEGFVIKYPQDVRVHEL